MQFEFSLQTAIIGSLGSSLILAGTLFYLWRLDTSQRALFYWSLGFLMQSLRMVAQLGVTLGVAAMPLLADALFAGAVLLVWRGCHELAGRPFRAAFVASLLAATLLWGTYGAAGDFPFIVRSLPLYAVAGGLLIDSGRIVRRLAAARPGSGYGLLALLFFLLGIHYLDYPFLRTVAWFAPVGFALASVLMLGIGIVMLIITQRTDRAERKETESRYQVLVDELDEGIIVVEADLRVSTANPAAARILDIALPDLRRRAITDIPYRLLYKPGEPAPAGDYPLYRALRKGETCSGEVLLMERADGSLLWLSINSRPLVRDGETAPYAAIVSFHDISAQKAAEHTLQASEIRFRGIFEGVANIAVQGYDRDCRVIYWNDASERFFGYRRDEALGRSIDELLVDVRGGEPFRQALDDWFAGGPAVPPGEFSVRRKDGEAIHVYSTQVMINNIAGEPEIYCIDLDLSERHRLQDELQEYSERFRAISESSELGVVVTDEVGSFIYCNPRYLALSASTPEEVRAGRWIDHLHPDDR
ncbi:MAG TPA: PAS domain S-box protein, partial [Azospira sp.]|nr:PAS domain S-box protein [Azospira sp.]